jgi:spermidine/putrescine-binding protein
MSKISNVLLGLSAGVAAATLVSVPTAAQQQQKPNIVIIWGDDVGQSNISAYSHGVMATRCPTSTALQKKA